MFYDDDIDIFFDAFAEDVLYTPFGGSAKSIKCIWDEPGTTHTFEGVVYQITELQCQVKSEDVTTVTNNKDTITRNSTVYYVKSHANDGTGIIILKLKVNQ